MKILRPGPGCSLKIFCWVNLWQVKTWQGRVEERFSINHWTVDPGGDRASLQSNMTFNWTGHTSLHQVETSDPSRTSLTSDTHSQWLKLVSRVGYPDLRAFSQYGAAKAHITETGPTRSCWWASQSSIPNSGDYFHREKEQAGVEKVPGPLEREAGCSHHEQVQVVEEGVTIKEVFRDLFYDCTLLFC